MATKKKAVDKKEAVEDEPAQPQKVEPSDINSSLASDRMKALLEDHRKMGSRP